MQHLRLHHHRRFPLGPQLGGAARGGERRLVVRGGRGGLGDGEVRGRELRMARGELAHHAQVCRLVRTAGEQAIQLQESALQIHTLARQQLLEVGFGLIDPLRRDEQRGDHLQRRRRLRLDLLPGLCRLQRELGQLALIRHLDRPPRHARVSGAARELEIGLCGQRVIAALHSDFAEQQLVERRLVQLLGIGLGERGAGQSDGK